MAAPGAPGGRGAGPGPRREAERAADGGESEHPEGDARRESVDDRRALTHPDLAAPDVRHHRTEQLRAAGRPGHPGRQDEQAQRVAGRRPPRVAEAARQRVAHDGDEHGRHGREGEHARRARRPPTSRVRRGLAPPLPTGRADGDRVGQGGALRRRLADGRQAAPARVRE